VALMQDFSGFAVESQSLPLVDFDIGESYAGTLPISDDPDDENRLFFWYGADLMSKWPLADSGPGFSHRPTPKRATTSLFGRSTPIPSHSQRLTLDFPRLNGGPGCSSMIGLLTENGPFTWMPGTYVPVRNEYSWSRLTNMIWIEQPVGVGYTSGKEEFKDEKDIATDFMAFYRNFIDAFQLHNKKTYITGESYAGMYIPYISDAFAQADDTRYFNPAGQIIINPSIGDSVTQIRAQMLPYVSYWNNLLYLNRTFVEELAQKHEQCGFTQYLEQYWKFPPPEKPFPLLEDAANDLGCDLQSMTQEAVKLVNPCFNIYHITEQCPFLSSPVQIHSDGDKRARHWTNWFNVPEVKKALHVEHARDWKVCTAKDPFGRRGDRSMPPTQNDVLRRVVEHSNNTIVASGNLDLLLPTNGTLMALQNMTWNDVQGFQEFPGKEFFVPYHNDRNAGSMSGAGIVGLWGEERGLTFVQVQTAGHSEF
jgi:carboxypeptidase D